MICQSNKVFSKIRIHVSCLSPQSPLAASGAQAEPMHQKNSRPPSKTQKGPFTISAVSYRYPRICRGDGKAGEDISWIHYQSLTILYQHGFPRRSSDRSTMSSATNKKACSYERIKVIISLTYKFSIQRPKPRFHSESPWMSSQKLQRRL